MNEGMTSYRGSLALDSDFVQYALLSLRAVMSEPDWYVLNYGCSSLALFCPSQTSVTLLPNGRSPCARYSMANASRQANDGHHENVVPRKVC